jgi:hypothetical protein
MPLGKFRRNPHFEAELKRSPEHVRWLQRLADEGADAVRANLPPFLVHRGAEVTGKVVDGAAVVEVRSSFWHWPEFGTVRMAMQPYLRPGVQVVLSRHGGRFSPSS